MKITYAMILTFILGWALIGCNSHSGPSGNGNEESTTQNLEKNVSGLTNIQLNNNNGAVQLKLISGSTLKVKAKKIVENGTAKLAEELFKEMVVSLRTSGDTVYIETSGYSKKIIDKYNSNASFAINFVLEVPSNLNVFNISTGNGDVTATSLTGAFKLKSGNGSITLNGNTNVTRSSTLNNGNGAIVVKLQKFESTQAMNITTGNGNINLSLASNIKCTLVIKQFMKDTKTINRNGAVKINATANLGTVEYSFF
jgi:hypothetical protein